MLINNTPVQFWILVILVNWFILTVNREDFCGRLCRRHGLISENHKQKYQVKENMTHMTLHLGSLAAETNTLCPKCVLCEAGVIFRAFVYLCSTFQVRFNFRPPSCVIGAAILDRAKNINLKVTQNYKNSCLMLDLFSINVLDHVMISIDCVLFMDSH